MNLAARHAKTAPPAYRRGWISILLVMLAILSGDVLGEDDGLMRINRVKAAFVLNISRFATWPSGTNEEKDTPFALCIYRKNSIGEAVKTIQDKQVSGRSLKISIVEGMEESASCKVLFIPFDELPRYKHEVSNSVARPLLSIADLTPKDAIIGRPHKGVMVSLVREGKKITLEVDLQQVQNAGLQISSQLLNLARIVSERSH